tara:strand:+ start:916 stop:1644 length:729 start_codon:yes stop_codon:yes gene_type:complete
VQNKKKVFIHGGSSLISINLVKLYINEFDEFHIFSRNISKTKEIFSSFPKEKFCYYENNLLNINQTLKDIDNLPNDLSAIFWITGSTGDPTKEEEEMSLLEENLKVNFINPVICINQLQKKMKIDLKNNFICVVTSVAGLRGRYKRLFYGSAKAGLINFLSGLRQKLNNKIRVITVIPGYINTLPFKETGPKFLIASPESAAKIIYNGIKKNKEIIYINIFWKFIMKLINFIPEKIFKKFKF